MRKRSILDIRKLSTSKFFKFEYLLLIQFLIGLLNSRLRLVQMGCENKVSELKSELKLKIFELERAQILNEEIIKNNQRSIIENEKLQKKIEVIIFVYYFI